MEAGVGPPGRCGAPLADPPGTDPPPVSPPPPASIWASASVPPAPSMRPRSTSLSSSGASSGSRLPPIAWYCFRNAKNSSGGTGSSPSSPGCGVDDEGFEFLSARVPQSISPPGLDSRIITSGSTSPRSSLRPMFSSSSMTRRFGADARSAVGDSSLTLVRSGNLFFDCKKIRKVLTNRRRRGDPRPTPTPRR